MCVLLFLLVMSLQRCQVLRNKFILCTGRAISCSYLAYNKRLKNTRWYSLWWWYICRPWPCPDRGLSACTLLIVIFKYLCALSTAFYINLFHLFNWPPLYAENLPPCYNHLGSLLPGASLIYCLLKPYYLIPASPAGIFSVSATLSCSSSMTSRFCIFMGPQKWRLSGPLSLPLCASQGVKPWLQVNQLGTVDGPGQCRHRSGHVIVGSAIPFWHVMLTGSSSVTSHHNEQVCWSSVGLCVPAQHRVRSHGWLFPWHRPQIAAHW